MTSFIVSKIPKIGLSCNWTKVCLSLASVFLVYKLGKFGYFWYLKRYISQQCQKIRTERDNELQRFFNKYQGIISGDRIKALTSLSASQIVIKIRNKEIKCYDIVLSFLLRTVRFGVEYNAIADLSINYLENCLKIAKEVDEKVERAKSSKDLPPLLGLPISIKDQIKLKDLSISIGGEYFPYLQNKQNKDDAEIVNLMKNLGAIPICLSNVPQSMNMIESYNELWGYCFNAWSKERAAGGSTGGEATLISLRCSPFGFGTDVGGSVRIPAAFNGIYGLKPSIKRISQRGLVRANNDSVMGWNKVMTSIGPMGRNVDDLVMVCRLIFGQFEFRNSSLDNRLFDEVEYNSRNSLLIGVLPKVDGFNYSAGVENVISEVTEFLSKKHTLIEIPENLVQNLRNCYFKLNVNSFNIESIEDTLQGQALLGPYQSLLTTQRLPNWVKALISIYLSWKGEKRASNSIKLFYRYDAQDVQNLVYYKFEKAKADISGWCIENKIDAFVSPVLGTPSIKVNNGSAMTLCHIHNTAFHNILDFPSGVVPIRLCRDGEDKYNDSYNDSYSKAIVNDVKGSVGLPICVQIGSTTGMEERTLRLMKELEDEFNFHQLQ